MSQVDLLRTPIIAANLLTVFNTVPSTVPGLQNYINSIFNPQVYVSSANCQTQVGLSVPIEIATPYLGYTLVSGGTLTQSILSQQFLSGVKNLFLRTTSTCTASGGLCQVCLASSGTPATLGTNITLPSTDRSPYLNYLATTYTGGLFRLSTLPGIQRLPLRRDLYSGIVNSTLNLQFLQQIQTDPQTLTYLQGLQDAFEQALALALIYVLS